MGNEQRKPASDVGFTDAVKAAQTQRGSRAAYRRMEEGVGWETTVTPELEAFLAERDSFYLATASANGQPYIQHRGGPPGFLRVVDEHTLGFVDFAGNRQYVTVGNLGENDRAFLFLMDYAHRRRIKIWGTARVVEGDTELQGKLMPAGIKARPERVILFRIAAWDVNCPQHIPKAELRYLTDVAPAIEQLKARIATLEAENRELCRKGGVSRARENGLALACATAAPKMATADMSSRERVDDELGMLRAQAAGMAEEAARSRRAVSILSALSAVPPSEDLAVTADRICRLLVPALARVCRVELREHDDTQLLAAAPASSELREGLVSEEALRLPLMLGNDVVGSLSVWPEAGRPFEPIDVQVVDASARHLTGVLTSIRLRARVLEVIDLPDRFLAMASHELRTPIHALGLGLALVLTRLRSTADELPRDWLLARLERVETQLKRIRLLVDTLLDASQLRAGGITLAPETLDLAGVARAIVDSMQEDLTWSGTPCTFSTDGPTEGTWDQLRVEIAITNLLTNAMKYGLARPIHVNVSGRETEVSVSVHDQGIGIAAEDQARLFRPFERLRAATPVASGFGLGLWIVRQLVEAQHGRVTLASAAGAGSVFTITLPRRT